MIRGPKSSTIVTVTDRATNTTTTVAAGATPAGVAVNPATNRIYVANELSNDVTVIDGATKTIITMGVGGTPLVVAVNPATKKIYVGNDLDNNRSEEIGGGKKSRSRWSPDH